MTVPIHDHKLIDRRGLAFARAIVTKLEENGYQPGVERARAVNLRWREIASSPLHEAWAALLQRNWPEIRDALLDPSERGDAMRQNNPFCGILTNRERWSIIKEFSRYAS
jgi:hypothetical protein